MNYSVITMFNYYQLVVDFIGGKSGVTMKSIFIAEGSCSRNGLKKTGE